MHGTPRSAPLAWVRLRSLLSGGSVVAFPRTWAKHAHSCCVAFANRRCQDILPPIVAYDICSGLLPPASRGPSLTRLRQTSSIVMLHQVACLFIHTSRCTQRWPVHATPVVITLAHITLVFGDSVMNPPHVVWQLHLWWVEQRLFECQRLGAPVLQLGTKLFSVPLTPLREHLPFNLNDCSLVSAQQHASPRRENKRDTRQMLTTALIPSGDDFLASFTECGSFVRMRLPSPTTVPWRNVHLPRP